MAWSGSAVFVRTFDGLGGTRNMNLTSDTLKAVLYNNSITPDKTVTAANSAYNAGQWATANALSDSTNWALTGQTLGSVTFTVSSNVYTFDAADTASSTSTTTISGAFGCLVYDDTATTTADQGVSYHYFGGTQSVTSGTFTIVWNASGLFTITV